MAVLPKGGVCRKEKENEDYVCTICLSNRIKRQNGFEQYKCFRELQEMHEDSVPESDSKSESVCDLESSSSSDWSVDEGNKRQHGKKRKMKTQSCNVSVQTGTTLVEKKEATSISYASQSLEEQMENDSPLTVTCGDKEGSLDRKTFSGKKKCIFSEGQWFKPPGFEKFGGKGKNKKWKNSILYRGVPLQKLIEDKHISSPNFERIRIQAEKSNSSPIRARLRGVKRNSSKSSCAAPTTSRGAGRARETKSRNKLYPSSSESEIMYNAHHEDKGNNNNEDDIDMTFQGPTLPVTYGSLFGILHKSRFATGFCGKCIRTEDFWLTPEEFSRLGKQDGAWKKDIVTHERPLGKLIMENVLELHSLSCECYLCLKLDDDKNDDECYMCDSEEDLVCCDECPRAFHQHCHLPAVDEESGGQWCCTFCTVKKVTGSNQMTPPDVLNSPLSQYRLQCQYLLLYLLHEVFVNKNMCETHDVKQNLQNDTYQTVGEFVTDIEGMFQHCTSIGDDDLMLRLFKMEFETIFKLL